MIICLYVRPEIIQWTQNNFSFEQNQNFIPSHHFIDKYKNVITNFSSKERYECRFTLKIKQNHEVNKKKSSITMKKKTEKFWYKHPTGHRVFSQLTIEIIKIKCLTRSYIPTFHRHNNIILIHIYQPLKLFVEGTNNNKVFNAISLKLEEEERKKRKRARERENAWQSVEKRLRKTARE